MGKLQPKEYKLTRNAKESVMIVDDDKMAGSDSKSKGKI